MGLMPTRITPKHWAMLVVALLALAAGGYLIYSSMQDPGQAVKGSGAGPAQPPPPSDVGGGAAPAAKGAVPVSPGPRKVAPK